MKLDEITRQTRIARDLMPGAGVTQSLAKAKAISEPFAGVTSIRTSIARVNAISDSIKGIDRLGALAGSTFGERIAGRGTIAEVVSQQTGALSPIRSLSSDLGRGSLGAGLAEWKKPISSRFQDQPSWLRSPGIDVWNESLRGSVAPLVEHQAPLAKFAFGSIAQQHQGLLRGVFGSPKRTLMDGSGDQLGARDGALKSFLSSADRTDGLFGYINNAFPADVQRISNLSGAVMLQVPRPGLDQVLPQSLKNFMEPGFWPVQVGRGFKMVRGIWQRRLDLEEELDGTQVARLLFMLEEIGDGHALVLLELLATEGPAPLVDLLDRALLAPEAIASLRRSLDEASMLRNSVQDDLRRGIDHLEKGEFPAALPDLMWGLEGAFRDGARSRGHKKRMKNAQSAIVKSKLAKERELFLRHEVYSTEGNEARHGEDADRRAFSLLALVGFICWSEAFHGNLTVGWLSQRLEAELERDAAEDDFAAAA